MGNIPNLLSLSRLPLAVVLFLCIAHEAWLIGLIVRSYVTKRNSRCTVTLAMSGNVST